MRSDLFIKTLALELLVLLGLGAAAEAVLRVTAPYYGEQVFDHELTAGRPMAVNRANFRGEPVAKAKSPGAFRILALGDSITFGTGVYSIETWPQRLGARYHERTGRAVDVVNAGIEGFSLSDLSHAYEADWASYDPDLVVLAVTANMISLEVVPRDAKPFTPEAKYAPFRAELDRWTRLKVEANRFVHRFCLPSFLSLNSQNALHWLGLISHNVDLQNPYGVVLAHGMTQGDLDPGLARTAWSRFEGHLGELQAKVARSGKTLVVTFVGPRFKLTDELRDNERNVPLERLTIEPAQELDRIAGRLGLVMMDARPALLERRAQLERLPGGNAPMYIPFDTLHLDAAGHDALAELLAARTLDAVAAP